MIETAEKPTSERETRKDSPRVRNVKTLAVLAGVILIASTVLALLGRHHWLCDLFTHFRVQYLFGLLSTGVASLVLGKRGLAILCLLFAGINASVVLPRVMASPRVAPSQNGPMVRVFFCNVNCQGGDKVRIAEQIARAQADIVVLAEINHIWLNDLAPVLKGYEHSIARPRRDNFGIAVYSHIPMPGAQGVDLGPSLIPTIVAEMQYKNQPFRLLATHPEPPTGKEPSANRNAQLQALAKEAKSNQPVIIVGDLNVTPYSTHFQDLLANGDLLDSSDGHGFATSWPAGIFPFWITIDHFLHSEDIYVISRVIGPDVGSDHYPLICDFTIAK